MQNDGDLFPFYEKIMLNREAADPVCGKWSLPRIDLLLTPPHLRGVRYFFSSVFYMLHLCKSNSFFH